MNLVIMFYALSTMRKNKINIHFNQTHITLVTHGDNMQLDLVFLWLTKA